MLDLYKLRASHFIISRSLPTFYFEEKGERKSPGSAIITNRSPSQTSKGRRNQQNQTSTSKQTYEKRSLFLKRGTHNTKRTEKHKNKITQGKA